MECGFKMTLSGSLDHFSPFTEPNPFVAANNESAFGLYHYTSGTRKNASSFTLVSIFQERKM